MVNSRRATMTLLSLLDAFILCRARFVLDFSWIAHQLDMGNGDVVVGASSQLGLISNLRPFLDSSAQTTRGNELDFFVNTKNGLV